MFADLLAGTYVPTAEEIEARASGMDERAGEPGRRRGRPVAAE